MNALRPARPPRRPGPRAGRTVVHGAESRAAPRPSLRVFGFLRLHLVLAAARHAGALAALRGSPGRDRSGFWAAWRTQGPSRRPRRSLQAVPNWPRGRFALTQHHPPRCTDRGQPPTLNLLCESPRRTAVRAFFSGSGILSNRCQPPAACHAARQTSCPSEIDSAASNPRRPSLGTAASVNSVRFHSGSSGIGACQGVSASIFRPREE